MKLRNRQHLVATIFPSSMLDIVKEQSQVQRADPDGEIVFLTGEQLITGRRVRLIAEEFERASKTVRVVRTL